MIEHKDQFWYFYNDNMDEFDERKFQSAFKHLLDVVLRKDFQDYPDQEELRSKAKIKLMELLQGDEVDDSYDDMVPFLHKSIWQELRNAIRSYKREREKNPLPVFVDDWSKLPEVYETEGLQSNFPIKKLHDNILELTDGDQPLTDHLMGVKLYEYFFSNKVMH